MSDWEKKTVEKETKAVSVLEQEGEEKGAFLRGLKVFLRALVRDGVTLSALIFIIVIISAAIWADFVAPHNPYKQELRLRNTGPNLEAPTQGGLPHVLGTDQLGRDELSRLSYGGRISLAVGISTVLVSGSIGTVMGLVAGFYRRWVDDVIMRLVDIWMGFPSLMLALAVLYALGPGFMNLVIVLAIVRWMLYARITRGMMLSLRETPFVEGARVVGCTDRRIMFRHMLPNLLAPILVLGTLEVARAVLSEAALSFLGLGIQPPEASWGLMLSQGREYITSAWWLVTFPGIAILITTLSFNLLATWLRAITDPTQRWRWLAAKKPSE
jgi:peptide/nickel transport system permease protein